MSIEQEIRVVGQFERSEIARKGAGKLSFLEWRAILALFRDHNLEF